MRRKSWRNLDPRKKMYQQSKSRAKRKGLEFNIELSDIIIPEYCPLLDVKFIIGTKDDYSLTPTLDRLDSSKGYIKGNIWVISMKANTMKSAATQEELLIFASNIFKYFKDDEIVRSYKKL